MVLVRRAIALAALVVAVSVANAGITYNIIEAKVKYNNGSENLTVTQSGDDNEQLDFTAPTPILVGDGAYTASGRAVGTVTIIYTATSTVPISGINLLFDYGVFNKAVLGYSELVEAGDGSATLASTSGMFKGSGAGGTDKFGSKSDLLTFSSPVTEYKVKKTFTLADLDSTPENSFASLGFIEQNAQPVPEPATMAAVAFGLAGLAARRRKRA